MHRESPTNAKGYLNRSFIALLDRQGLLDALGLAMMAVVMATMNAVDMEQTMAVMPVFDQDGFVGSFRFGLQFDRLRGQIQ